MSYSHTPDQTRNEPVLVAMSILAALQFFFAGATGVSLFTGSDLVAGIMAAGSLATAAAQTGIQFYVRGQVTPMADVSELVKDGKVIAGPANDILPSGVTVREVGEPPVDHLEALLVDEPVEPYPGHYNGDSKTDATWHGQDDDDKPGKHRE